MLERYSTAYNTNDAALLETTYDTSNAPLRRLFRERFAAFQESVLGGVVSETYRLKATTPLSDGFVLATVERSSDQFVADWPLRHVQDRWVFAEPSAEQVGKPIKSERDGFIFSIYPWNEPIREQLIAGVLAARDIVKAKLGTVPSRPVEMIIRPSFGISGVESGVPTAYYTTTSQDRDRLVIYAPQSLAFVFYDPAKGWAAALRAVLQRTTALGHPELTPRDWVPDTAYLILSCATTALGVAAYSAIAAYLWFAGGEVGRTQPHCQPY